MDVLGDRKCMLAALALRHHSRPDFSRVPAGSVTQQAWPAFLKLPVAAARSFRLVSSLTNMNAHTVSRTTRQLSRQALNIHHAHPRLLRCSVQAQRPFAGSTAPPSLLRKRFPATRIANQLRHESNEAVRPSTERSRSASEQSQADEIAARKAQEPAYEMTFTCKKCLERSSHRVTKQAYHFGTTLITCPGCKNRHLISDHLKIFSDKNITLEDILKEKGQFLRKGRIGDDGDVEFVDESTVDPVLLGQPKS